MSMTRNKTILLSLLLSLPVIAVVLHHYFGHVPGLHPTGFLIDENVLYMSYAHQYLDQEAFSFFYSNPFDGDPGSPKIYFQPFQLIFAALMRGGADPGLCFSLFGICMAIGCIYIGIKIILHLLPQYEKPGLVASLFTWGGGLTAITGLLVNSFAPTGVYSQWIDGIYLADPAQGWWGLNWGRTLFIPLEAGYHFLFLLNIYLVLKQKWVAGIIVAFFLSISHPFTGIEYLLIMNGWLILEKILDRNNKVPLWFLVALLAITVFHGWYYLIYLNSFPEHNLIFTQYSAAWTYSLRVVLPAYCLVIGLAILAMYINRPARKFLSAPQQRLFLCWALIAFLLSKHEWFIEPMQPIHFTRGYVWAGLFLFALPAITWLINYLHQTHARKWLLYGFIILFLSDNILWTFNILRGKATTEWEGHITSDTRQVLGYLNKNAVPGDLVVGTSPLVNYLVNVYTSANAWVSHPYNTPARDERSMEMKNFLLTGSQPPAWTNRRILVVINKKKESPAIYPALQKNKLFENDTYAIFTP